MIVLICSLSDDCVIFSIQSYKHSYENNALNKMSVGKGDCAMKWHLVCSSILHGRLPIHSIQMNKGIMHRFWGKVSFAQKKDI